MGIGGFIIGVASAIAGPRGTLLGAAVLFLSSLILVRRLSINFTEKPEEKLAGGSSVHIERGGTPIARTRNLLTG
jgi:hypothetical protein